MFSTQDLETESGLNAKAISKFFKNMLLEPERIEGKTMFWTQENLNTLLEFGPKPRAKRVKTPPQPAVTREEFDELKKEMAQVKHVLKLMHARYSRSP